MNEARRQAVRTICKMLEGIEEHLDALGHAEEEAFVNRSSGSKQTELGLVLEDVVRTLLDARDEINTQRGVLEQLSVGR